MRIVYNVPLDTHCYLVETISKSLHPKVMLCARFVSFHIRNISCKKSSVNLIANLNTDDQRTCYGRNLRNISDECNVAANDLTKLNVKTMMKYRAVPEDEVWRAKLIDELLGARLGHLDIALETDEIEAMLSFACCS